MGWKKDFPILRDRLVKKSKSAGALDKQVQILANELGLTSKEALFVLAKRKEVGYQSDFKRLSKDEQSRISQAVAGGRPAHTSSIVRVLNKSPAAQIDPRWYEKWWGIIVTNAAAGILAGIIVAMIIALASN